MQLKYWLLFTMMKIHFVSIDLALKQISCSKTLEVQKQALTIM